MARENITEYDGFPARLRKLREQRGISQKTLSELCGLSKNMISRYEKGKRIPNIETLGELCDFFDVSADYLMGRN